MSKADIFATPFPLSFLKAESLFLLYLLLYFEAKLRCWYLESASPLIHNCDKYLKAYEVQDSRREVELLYDIHLLLDSSGIKGSKDCHSKTSYDYFNITITYVTASLMIFFLKWSKIIVIFIMLSFSFMRKKL